MEKAKINSQERILRIVEMLVENQVFGMSNKSLATKLGATEANICRDLKILESQGWIEKMNGVWRLSPKFGGFVVTITEIFQEGRRRLTEDEARLLQSNQRRSFHGKK